MTRVIIDLLALRYNLDRIGSWMRARDANWTVVTKALCGHKETIRGLGMLGVRSMGDSRFMNIRAIRDTIVDAESWYLRPPELTAVPDVIELTHVSLNSEMRVIEALNEEAGRQGKKHQVIIMIELGDLREGILPGTLVDFYRRVFSLRHVEVLGIGANLGCLAGSVPTVDQFMQLVLYRQLLELKFETKLHLISAGSSAVLPLAIAGGLPKEINHFRIGESLFLGTDLVNSGTLDGMRGDVVILEAEIAEIKEKSLVPMGETINMTPFDSASNSEDYSPGQRGHRALVTVGQLDTEVGGLTPLNSSYRIAGASSDITVVNLGDNPERLQVGGTIRFRLDYSALLRLMSSQYVPKIVTPRLAQFERQDSDSSGTAVDPVIESSDESSQQATAG